MEYVLLVTGLSTDMLKFLLISLSFLQRLIFQEIPIVSGLTTENQLAKKIFNIFKNENQESQTHLLESYRYQVEPSEMADKNFDLQKGILTGLA